MDKPHMSIIEKMSKKANKENGSNMHLNIFIPFSTKSEKLHFKKWKSKVYHLMSSYGIMVKWAYKKKRWQDVNSL